MKRTLLLIISLLIFGMATTSAQVYKLRTSSIATTMTDESGTWEDWSDWEEVSLLVTLDIPNLRITIYSDEKQTYDITSSEEETTDENGDTIYQFECVDQDGDECSVKFMERVSQEDQRSEIYVLYDEYAWVYKVYSLDDIE